MFCIVMQQTIYPQNCVPKNKHLTIHNHWPPPISDFTMICLQYWFKFYGLFKSLSFTYWNPISNIWIKKDIITVYCIDSFNSLRFTKLQSNHKHLNKENHITILIQNLGANKYLRCKKYCSLCLHREFNRDVNTGTCIVSVSS